MKKGMVGEKYQGSLLNWIYKEQYLMVELLTLKVSNSGFQLYMKSCQDYVFIVEELFMGLKDVISKELKLVFNMDLG